MAAVALRNEERIGLAVAIVAHAALVALLLLKPHAPPVVIPPDRVEVTLSDEVGLKSTSPEPNAQAAPDVAPELGEPAPAEPLPAPPAPKVEPPQPEPPKPLPPKPPRPTAKPEPPKPAPRPVPRPEPKPVAKRTMRPEPPRPVA
jgi:outer membrane biosynthesis protein TonB